MYGFSLPPSESASNSGIVGTNYRDGEAIPLSTGLPHLKICLLGCPVA